MSVPVYGIGQETAFRENPLIGDWLVVMKSEHERALREQEEAILNEYANRDYDGITPREHTFRVRRAVDEAVAAEREKHHTNRCCAVCGVHTMPHRGCILR